MNLHLCGSQYRGRQIQYFYSANQEYNPSSIFWKLMVVFGMHFDKTGITVILNTQAM